MNINLGQYYITKYYLKTVISLVMSDWRIKPVKLCGPSY